MKELDRLIFDDLILCFFNLRHSLNSPPGNAFRDVCIENFKDSFPENEHVKTSFIAQNGRFEDVVVNYIKEIN